MNEWMERNCLRSISTVPVIQLRENIHTGVAIVDEHEDKHQPYVLTIMTWQMSIMLFLVAECSICKAAVMVAFWC